MNDAKSVQAICPYYAYTVKGVKCYDCGVTVKIDVNAELIFENFCCSFCYKNCCVYQMLEERGLINEDFRDDN